ncbi:MarR family winged helix-turn-helix transcriptional regulator [Halobacillus massiliensis]|uniref:MarR family winged helix-turn-helix transcriptional regulator n=1 Tax=Halobacillus massiliensis TaxID=1926286 RepID=UPI0009E3C468|nr:MarR family transcriptional regulator [Halobacillus massiliensis]
MSLVFHHIQQLSRDVNQYLNRALKDEPIYMSHWAVIYQLHEQEPLTQTELKERLNIEAPPLSRTIKRLEELKYIRKTSSSDKRRNELFLTSEGKANFPRWQQAIQSAEDGLIEKFGESSKQELDHLVMSLTTIIRTQGGKK